MAMESTRLTVKRLVEIKVLVEVESAQEVESLTSAFEKAICPHSEESHPDQCPTRWFIVSTDLDDEEAAEWEEVLNE